jgi:ubiquinone/menaquinone biosynthesis C-methylase UbiE
MKRKKHRLKLLASKALVKTGPVDHADWNFRPILGWIQRLRFRMIQALLPKQPVDRLLEVGYGSGIFMPTLADYCYELHGIDVHPCDQKVTAQLRSHHIEANLRSGTVESLPYPNHFFDVVVAVSCLEFVENIDTAVQELQRVVKPGGRLILVTPGYSTVLDWGLRILTGESAQQDYSNRRQRLIPVLQQYFSVSKQRTFPRFGQSFLCLYTALNLAARPSPQEPQQRLPIALVTE